jgi:DNA polymerase III delta subunit
MIYLFAGDDATNKIKAHESFLKGRANLPLISISKNNFNKMEIESLYSGASLFDSQSVVAFSNILDNQDISLYLLDKLELLQESNNIFIFSEGKLLKPVLNSFEKVKATVNIFELRKEQKEKFNNFLLADAFATKDKIKLWLYYRQAVDLGVGLEELTGVLFWKVKDMMLKKNFSKYTEEELKNIVNKVAYLLPEARKKGRDAEIIFEKFILEIL